MAQLQDNVVFVHQGRIAKQWNVSNEDLSQVKLASMPQASQSSGSYLALMNELWSAMLSVMFACLEL